MGSPIFLYHQKQEGREKECPAWTEPVLHCVNGSVCASVHPSLQNTDFIHGPGAHFYFYFFFPSLALGVLVKKVLDLVLSAGKIHY